MTIADKDYLFEQYPDNNFNAITAESSRNAMAHLADAINSVQQAVDLLTGPGNTVDFTELVQRLTNAEQAIVTLTGRADANDQNLQTMNDAHAALQQVVDALNVQVNGIQTDLSAVGVTLDDAVQRIVALEAAQTIGP